MVGSIYGYTTAYRFTLIDYNVQGWHTYEYNNWRAVDALLNSFVSLLNFRGMWANNTTYALNDLAADPDDSLLYKATAGHTSPTTGSFSAARAASPGQWVAIDQTAFNATSNRLMKRLRHMFQEANAINANASRAYNLAVASITAAAASATLAATAANNARTAASQATALLNSEKRVRRLVRTFNPANIAFYSQVFS